MHKKNPMINKEMIFIIFDENGMIKKGVIIRHLVLPNHIRNSKMVLKWIKQNMPEDICVSVMAQYFPTHKAKEGELLNRKITQKEYKLPFLKQFAHLVLYLYRQLSFTLNIPKNRLS